MRCTRVSARVTSFTQWTGRTSAGRKRAFLSLAVMLCGLAIALSGKAQSGEIVLNAVDAGKMLPEKVYFKGQSATTQLRNSGGVKFADGQFVLAVMVDASGYSSDVSQRYQAYLFAEDPIRIEGHALAAGAYGVGFVAGEFVVMDIGGHDLFTVPSHHDQEMKRPTPLKVVADSSGFRLYEGRNYVGFSK